MILRVAMMNPVIWSRNTGSWFPAAIQGSTLTALGCGGGGLQVITSELSLIPLICIRSQDGLDPRSSCRSAKWTLCMGCEPGLGPHILPANLQLLRPCIFPG